jgi:hypothetical protein
MATEIGLEKPVALKSINLALKTPFVEIAGTWEPNDAERAAAWELYVELVTRIAVVPLPGDQGLDSEALTSVYQLFAIHREVLRRYGPAVAEKKKRGEYNLAYLAVATLNFVVRPFLATWHPILDAVNSARPPDVSAADHERSWPRHEEFRAELAKVRESLRIYAQWLSYACGVPDLLEAVPTAAPD